MRIYIYTLVLLITSVLSGSCQNNATNKQQSNLKPAMSTNTVKTEAEWKKQLTDEQYYVLREKGTERPFSGKYNMHFEKGIYKCAGCGFELFADNQKFESHCGWPSFDSEIGDGTRIKKIKDSSHGMIRTEIVCANCNGHLGHIFDDGPTKTGQRYCVNSLSIDFIPAKETETK